MNWAKSYIYAGSRLLSTITKSGSSELTEYHHPDRLGTKLVTDSTANTAKSQSTLPFGALISAETQATTNQKFTSYDRSGATGLDYAVNRTYNSGQSRFTQVDPIGMASASIGNPQSLNMFAYTQNNPVDFADPSGLQLRHVDVSQGLACVLKEDGVFHCTEYINRYWYDDGVGSGSGSGGGEEEPGGGGGKRKGPKAKAPSAKTVQHCLDSTFGKGFKFLNLQVGDSAITSTFSYKGKSLEVRTKYREYDSYELGKKYAQVNREKYNEGDQQSGLTTNASKLGNRVTNFIAIDVAVGISEGKYKAIGGTGLLFHEIGNALGWYLYSESIGASKNPFKWTNDSKDRDIGKVFEKCLFKGGIVNLTTGRTGNSRGL